MRIHVPGISETSRFSSDMKIIFPWFVRKNLQNRWSNLEVRIGQTSTILNKLTPRYSSTNNPDNWKKNQYCPEKHSTYNNKRGFSSFIMLDTRQTIRRVNAHSHWVYGAPNHSTSIGIRNNDSVSYLPDRHGQLHTATYTWNIGQRVAAKVQICPENRNCSKAALMYSFNYIAYLSCW